MRALLCICLLAAACEDRPPPAPDFAGEVTFDLGPPRDLPAPFGLDGNFLPAPDPAGTFVLSVTDESGAPLPSRVVFRPPPGEGFGDSLTTPLTPQSPSDGTLIGATVSPGVVGMPEGVLLQTGWGTVSVPPGRYKLLFTRGPEYESSEVEISVDAGEAQAINVELHRSVDTRGWLAADLHVHASNSFDSRLPLDRRVISEIANGIEVLVSTEHHGTFDFSSLLPELGYGDGVAVSLAGNELNFKQGHAGVYPLDPDPTQPRGGSPPYQSLDDQGECPPPVVGTNCLEATDAFTLMHGLRPRGTIVTLNHAWFGWSDLGYFTNIGWGAGTTASFPSPLPIAGSFDAMEVLNGYILHPEAFAYLFADWMYLVSEGYHVAALGNSDSHNLKFVYAGSPRTMLRFPTDRPGDVDGDALYDAIGHQRAIATTGPFVTLEVNGGQIGDVVGPRQGSRAEIHIVADAPTWMSLDDVVVFKNGRELRRFMASTSRRPRLDMYMVDELEGDAFYVVLATGMTPLPDDLAGEQTALDMLPVYPIALTNPVFVDYENDGSLRYAPMLDGKLPWTPPKNPGSAKSPMTAPPPRPLVPSSMKTAHPQLDEMPASIPDPFSQLLPLL